MRDAKIELDTKLLDQFIRLLKTSSPKIKIGILSDSPHNSGKTTVYIGTQHEFGLNNMPKRSFLRMPLNTLLNKRVQESNITSEAELKAVFAENSLINWMHRVAAIAQAIVMEAFDTEGFGKWPKWRTPGYTSQTGMILQNTRQLRDSITTEVKESM